MNRWKDFRDKCENKFWGKQNSTKCTCESLAKRKSLPHLHRNRSMPNKRSSYNFWLHFIHTLKFMHTHTQRKSHKKAHKIQFSIWKPFALHSIWISKPNYLKWKSYTIINFIPSVLSIWWVLAFICCYCFCVWCWMRCCCCLMAWFFFFCFPIHQKFGCIHLEFDIQHKLTIFGNT